MNRILLILATLFFVGCCDDTPIAPAPEPDFNLGDVIYRPYDPARTPLYVDGVRERRGPGCEREFLGHRYTCRYYDERGEWGNGDTYYLDPHEMVLIDP